MLCSSCLNLTRPQTQRRHNIKLNFIISNVQFQCDLCARICSGNRIVFTICVYCNRYDTWLPSTTPCYNLSSWLKLLLVFKSVDKHLVKNTNACCFWTKLHCDSLFQVGGKVFPGIFFGPLPFDHLNAWFYLDGARWAAHFPITFKSK